MSDEFVLTAQTTKTAPEIHGALEKRSGWTAKECSGSYQSDQTGATAELSWDIGETGAKLQLTVPVGCPEVFGDQLRQEWRYLSENLACSWESANSEASLVEAWRQQNIASVKAAGETKFTVIDPERRREAWRWNNQRQMIQSNIGEAIFVPRIVFFARSDEAAPRRARRGVIWPDAIPIAVPNVELIVLTVPDDSRFSASPGPYILQADTVLDRLRRDDEELVALHPSPIEHRRFVWQTAPYELIGELAQTGEPAADSLWEGVSATNVVEDTLTEES